MDGEAIRLKETQDTRWHTTVLNISPVRRLLHVGRDLFKNHLLDFLKIEFGNSSPVIKVKKLSCIPMENKWITKKLIASGAGGFGVRV